MGGRKGQTKRQIILALYEAEVSGEHITATDLAALCKRLESTISEHLADLRERGFVRECGTVRGWLELTSAGRAFARSLLPQPEGIEYRGIIAAGPAARVEEVHDTLMPPEFDPANHFALKVRGTSMISFGILDGDIAIFRKFEGQNIAEGKIVAARVPEGTGIDDDDWLDHLEAWISRYDEAHDPPCDHVTLKQFNARFRSYWRRGVEQQRAVTTLRGSSGSFRPRGIEIDGILAYLMRGYD